MSRLESIQQIYKRLAELERYREEVRQQNKPCDEIDKEIAALRFSLKKLMNYERDGQCV